MSTKTPCQPVWQKKAVMVGCDQMWRPPANRHLLSMKSSEIAEIDQGVNRTWEIKQPFS